MPATPQATAEPRKRKRSWWRRLLRVFLWLFLLLLIFHRSIVHYGGRWAAIYFAKKQHLALDLRIEGNLWSRFELHDVKAAPTGTGPAPLEKLSLDSLILEYDVMKLVKGDLNGLRALRIGQVEAVVTPLPPKPPRPEPSTPLAETLRSLLTKPMPAPVVQIGKVDVRVKDPKGDIVVQNFRLSLTPGTPGQVGWDRLELPGLKPVEPFAAQTQFAAGNLRVETSAGATPILAFAAQPAAGAKAGELGVELNLLGFRTAVKVAPAATGGKIQAAVAVETLDVTTVTKAIGVDVPVAAEVSQFTVNFEGDPDAPTSWQIDTLARVNGIRTEAVSGIQTDAQLSVRDLTLKVDRLKVSGMGADFAAQGTLPLPKTISDENLIPKDGAFTFQLAVPDLATVGKDLKTPLAGQVQGQGSVVIKDSNLQFQTTLDATKVEAPGARVAKAAIKLQAGLPLHGKPSLRQLVATAEAAVDQVEADAAQIEQVRLRAGLQNLEAKIEELRVARGESVATVAGDVKLTEEGQLASKPAVKFSLLVPALADFGIKANDALLNGVVTGEGTLTVEEPFTNSHGTVYLRASSLQLGDTKVGEVIVDTEMKEGHVIVKKIEADLAGETTLEITGRTALEKPFAYGGKLMLNAPDLSAFAPLLRQFGQDTPLAGRVKIDLAGEGSFTEPDGEVRLEAKDVRFGTTEIQESRIAAKFTPTSAETEELSVVMDKLRVAAKLAWKEKRVSISGLDVKLDGSTVLAGDLSAPLDPAGPKPLPTDQPLQAKLVAKELDLVRLMNSLGQPASVAGTVSLDLEASGTLAQPKITLETKALKVRALPPPPDPKKSKIVQPQPVGTSTTADPIPPTDLETKVVLANDKVDVTGTVRQPLIQPLTFKAQTTFALAPLLDGQKVDFTKLPLQASVNLPASSLAFLPKLSPAVAKVEGTAAVALRVAGEVGKPALEGTTDLDLKMVRLTNGAVPVLTNFRARLAFANNRLTFPTFTGEAGGGQFTLTGNIDLQKLSEPLFDLALKSKDVLVLRDDVILVRAETDLTLKGPLPTATAAGTVYITQSRINKEVEILPLSLPGKPKPVPKVAAQATRISFPDPPLRDWKFDIAVKTRADDAFQIRGNLARGKVMLDVRLAGTGLNPYLTGAATIEQFSATLPLSTLTTRRGVVTFSQESPFQPYVELEAESKIRQYTVVARVTGPATKPQLDLESEPPLPQQEILSLLTTGSLTGEIGANNTALATRAAVLVVKSWYKKLFKKDFPLGGDNDDQDSILDRFEVDFGAVDPKTGRNETTAQLRVTDRLFFIGDLEMGGGFSGRVKYLFRFR